MFLGLLGGALPVMYVVTVRNRRLRRLQHQLPDAFDVISRMMQAGRTFPQAMQTAAQDAVTTVVPGVRLLLRPAAIGDVRRMLR